MARAAGPLHIVHGLSDLRHAAVFLSGDIEGQMHSGFALDTAAISYLHLMRHLKLSSNVPPDLLLVLDPPFSDERLELVATLCRRINKLNRTDGIPYGFSCPELRFDQSGKLRISTPDSGLTCASFVLAVFDSAGLPLLDYTTWASPASAADQFWQDSIINIFEQSGVDPTHIELLKKEKGVPRFRPDQVAGAAASESAPVEHSRAETLAATLRRHISL